MAIFFVRHILTIDIRRVIIHNTREKGSEKIISECCLVGVLVLAALEDFTRYQVSNRLIIAGWITGMIFSFCNNDLAGIISWCLNVTVSILLLFFLFRFKMLGAGDIKLLSVISGFMGISLAIEVFEVAVIIGGVFSVVKCIRYGYLINRLSYFRQYISELLSKRCIRAYYVKKRDGDTVVIPFSVAIGLAFFIVYSGVADDFGLIWRM